MSPVAREPFFPRGIAWSFIEVRKTIERLLRLKFADLARQKDAARISSAIKALEGFSELLSFTGDFAVAQAPIFKGNQPRIIVGMAASRQKN
jgi:hypothetical protein